VQKLATSHQCYADIKKMNSGAISTALGIGGASQKRGFLRGNRLVRPAASEGLRLFPAVNNPPPQAHTTGQAVGGCWLAL
jgi:hypothetical protein